MGKTTLPSFDAGPTLFLVGSFAPISQEQARQLAMSSSVFSLIIPYQLMLDDQGSESRQELSCAIANHLERCDDVLLALDSADRCSNDQGLRLTRSLAQTIKPFAATIGALVATGGETARAIMDEWNIQRLEVLGEVETGVALSRPVNWSRNIPVITKAGGFGTPETLVHCRRFLQDLKRVNPSHI
jgi:4-hydroxythreonine-4-phosphate dehydrogenase